MQSHIFVYEVFQGDSKNKSCSHKGNMTFCRFIVFRGAVYQEIFYLWSNCPLNFLWLGGQHCICLLPVLFSWEHLFFSLVFLLLLYQIFSSTPSLILCPSHAMQSVVCVLPCLREVARLLSICKIFTDSSLVFQSTLIIENKDHCGAWEPAAVCQICLFPTSGGSRRLCNICPIVPVSLEVTEFRQCFRSQWT